MEKHHKYYQEKSAAAELHFKCQTKGTEYLCQCDISVFPFEYMCKNVWNFVSPFHYGVLSVDWRRENEFKQFKQKAATWQNVKKREEYWTLSECIVLCSPSGNHGCPQLIGSLGADPGSFFYSRQLTWIASTWWSIQQIYIFMSKYP